MNKKTINLIRNHYIVSRILRVVLKPVQIFSSYADKQIRMKVWINGKTVIYDEIALCFPKNIGVSFCSRIYWDGVKGFEPFTWKVIRYFVERSRLFLDIGSNIGLYSVLAKKVNQQIVVRSYEPVPGIFEKNIRFHQANSLPCDYIENAAVDETTGEAEIYLPVNDDRIEEETTATLAVESWQSTKNHATFVVRTIKLDDIVSEKPPEYRVIIKIDVEGFEENVLRGAIELLSKTRPAIVCEVLPADNKNKETVRILKKYGYAIFGISSDGLIRFEEKDFIGSRTFRDFLFIHESMATEYNYINYKDIDVIRW